MAYKKREQKAFLVPYKVLRQFELIGDAATGRIIRAMGAYSQFGVVPDFSSEPLLQMLWLSLASDLDENKNSYESTCRDRSYAGWCSALHSAGKDYLKLPQDEWELAHEGYDAYLEQLAPRQTALPFTEWLQDTKDRAKDEIDAVLPWDSPGDSA